MASKYRACDTARVQLRSVSRLSPDRDVERRLREAFPDVWARYEWLLAARTLSRRHRKPS
jgi:hypothetical protein